MKTNTSKNGVLTEGANGIGEGDHGRNDNERLFEEESRGSTARPDESDQQNSHNKEPMSTQETPASHPVPGADIATKLTSTMIPGESEHSRSLQALIAEQPFFKGLSADHLRLLTNAAMEMEFEPGQSILQEGGPANRFYLILQGKVVLESEVKEHGTVPIRTLGPGDDLGWSWLFPPYYLHFSARAVEPTKTIFFYGTRLREQCEQDHELGYQLMKRVAEVVVHNLDATKRRLTECTDPTEPSHP